MVSADDCGQLPLVYIIGMQKAASTSLAGAVRAAGFRTSNGECCHRAGWGHCNEESHFFQYSDKCKGHDLSECGSAYQKIFPKGGAGVYDATPQAGNDPHMPQALYTVMPVALRADVRLILTLREPASRFLSWYNHKLQESPCNYCSFCKGKFHGKWQGGTFSPTFTQDVECNIAAYQDAHAGWQTWYERHRSGDEPGNPGAPLDIVRSIVYPDAVESWGKAFGRSQLLVLNFHSLVSDSTHFMQLIGSFVGLSLGRLPHSNSAEDPRVVKTMCCEDWCRLQAVHAESNERLYTILNEQHLQGVPRRGVAVAMVLMVVMVVGWRRRQWRWWWRR